MWIQQETDTESGKMFSPLTIPDQGQAELLTTLYARLSVACSGSSTLVIRQTR